VAIVITRSGRQNRHWPRCKSRKIHAFFGKKKPWTKESTWNT